MIMNPRRTAHYIRYGAMALAVMMSLASTVMAQGTAEEIIFSPGLTFSGDIFEFEISPDGTKVVFIAVLDNGTNNQQTYVAPVVSGVANAATLVVPNNVGDNDGGVRWTPDGLSVLTRYAPTFTGNANEIFLLPADGSQTATQLTSGSANAFDQRVSADGNSLFSSDLGSLFVRPIAGGAAIQLNPGDISEIDTGTYSVVGNDVYFAGFSTAVPGADNNTREDTIYRTAADGSTANSPTNIPITNFPADTALNIGRFEVTSDGQTIVLQGDLSLDGTTQLYSMPAEGGDFVELFSIPLESDGVTPRVDFDVNFFKLSNDGTMVAFVSDFLTNGVGEAFIVPTSGGTPVRVSDSADFSQANGFDVAFTGAPDRLQFSPDDSALYYVTDDGHDGQFGLFRVPITSTVLKGDVDLNGTVEFLDIQPFIGVLTANGDQAEADCDCNGVVNFLDIQSFIDILASQ